MKKYIIYAGVNGAGKTTLYQSDIESKEDVARVNTDEILREFGSWKDGKDIMQAGKIAVRKLNDFIEQGISFNQETTLCGHLIMKMIQRAQDVGYLIEVHYVGLNSPELAKKRISERVKAGGHGIPDEDVERRYYESLKNLRLIMDKCDLLVLYDNTEKFRQFAVYQKGNLVWQAENIPQWYRNWETGETK